MNKDIILKGLEYYGQREIRGDEDNPIILKMLQGVADWASSDEVAWCSAFVNHVAEELGYPRSKSLAARSWLYVGKEVKDPEPGDIAIFWRGSPHSWQGHVGIFISKDKTHIHVLGGNQSNQVNIAAYSKERLLGYRRLRRQVKLESLKIADTTIALDLDLEEIPPEDLAPVDSRPIKESETKAARSRRSLKPTRRVAKPLLSQVEYFAGSAIIRPRSISGAVPGHDPLAVLSEETLIDKILQFGEEDTPEDAGYIVYFGETPTAPDYLVFAHSDLVEILDKAKASCDPNLVPKTTINYIAGTAQIHHQYIDYKYCELTSARLSITISSLDTALKSFKTNKTLKTVAFPYPEDSGGYGELHFTKAELQNMIKKAKASKPKPAPKPKKI